MFFLSKKGQQASRLFVKKTGSRPVDFFLLKITPAGQVHFLAQKNQHASRFFPREQEKWGTHKDRMKKVEIYMLLLNTHI